MRHALFLLALSVALIVGWGILFSVLENVSTFTGLYWSVTTATTVGYGDVTPHALSGHWLAIGAMLTEIPAMAACFGMATSAHIRYHMRRHMADHSRAGGHRLALVRHPEHPPAVTRSRGTRNEPGST